MFFLKMRYNDTYYFFIISSKTLFEKDNKRKDRGCYPTLPTYIVTNFLSLSSLHLQYIQIKIQFRINISFLPDFILKYLSVVVSHS